uniref:Stress response protein NST1-like n=1 Tax=Cucumis sativus TaxID=3659 RepID=A0A0A0LB45_CUCSA
MKRKKWSEQEEETLLSKYSDLLNCGTLAKLKTREKKFKPIADHVNSVHHLQDPLTFPFRWSWRDVSIKVQNMRHQYLGVKQKIRVSDDDFNWKDGENHWQNFMKYKQVFGDLPLDLKGKRLVFGNGAAVDFDGSEDLEFGIGVDSDDLEEEEEEEEDEDLKGREHGRRKHPGHRGGPQVVEVVGNEGKCCGFGQIGVSETRKSKKGSAMNRRLGMVGMRVLELRDMAAKREEQRRERAFRREKNEVEREEKMKNIEFKKEKLMNEKEEQLDNRELEIEERELQWRQREFENRMRMEREFEEERRKRMRMEEKMEEEEMEWRERIVEMQIEHEKQMMQMQAEAFQNQMQILGVIARLLCQYFGSANDGLGSGLGALPPQVLQNLQHPGELDDNGKPDANSPSEFL